MSELEIYKKAAVLLELETSESGILISIDTADEYKLHFGVNPWRLLMPPENILLL